MTNKNKMSVETIARVISDRLERRGPQIVYLMKGNQVSIINATREYRARERMDEILNNDREDLLGYYLPGTPFKSLCDDLRYAHEVDCWPLSLSTTAKRV